MAEPTADALDKRREIVRASAPLFDRQGYANTSMTDIAEACGLRKPTLYHYFGSKDAILFEIHDQLMDDLQARLDARLAQTDQPAARAIEGTIHDVLDAFATHPGFARVFIEAHRELPEEHRRVVAAKRDRYSEQFEGLIEQAQDDGDLRRLDVTLTRLSVLGMASWAYHWLDTHGAMPIDAIARFMWDVIFGGLASDRDGEQS